MITKTFKGAFNRRPRFHRAKPICLQDNRLKYKHLGTHSVDLLERWIYLAAGLDCEKGSRTQVNANAERRVTAEACPTDRPVALVAVPKIISKPTRLSPAISDRKCC